MAIGVDEDEGRRFPGAERGTATERRHRADGHSSGDVLDGRARVRGEVRPSITTRARGDGARRLKNHYNGARNPRAQFRKEVAIETIINSPKHSR